MSQLQPHYISIANLFGVRTRYTVPFFQRAYVWSRAEQVHAERRRRQTDALLREREERLRGVLDGLGEGFGLQDFYPVKQRQVDTASGFALQGGSCSELPSRPLSDREQVATPHLSRTGYAGTTFILILPAVVR